MVTNSFGIRNFMHPMGRLSKHSKCLDFFSFKFWVGGVEGGGRGIFFLLSFVPFKSPMFPMSSPKGVPNSTSL